MADIGMVIGQFPGLFRDRLGDLLAAIADIDAIEPGEAVEQAVAVAVLDEDALAAGDDPFRQFASGELGQMGGRVEEVLAVPLLERIVSQHWRIFLSGSSFQAQSRHRYLTSVKASSPKREPSRSSPDCFMPPKGIGAPVTLVRLTATMPNCSAREAR